jgi:hypothetical protein
MCEDRIDALLELRTNYVRPFSFWMLKEDWDASRGMEPIDSESIGHFIVIRIRAFEEALNYDSLAQLCNGVLGSIAGLEPIKYQDFCPQNKEPDFHEVQRLIHKIYEKQTENQAYREECVHYLGVLRQALQYVDSLEKSLFGLIQSLGKWFRTKTERNEFQSYALMDLKLLANALKALSQNFKNSVEDVLKVRQNILLRADSAIRLLVESARTEFPNTPKAHHGGKAEPSVEPKEVLSAEDDEGSEFDLTEVG